jgi:imidazoleglycerol-phosphate dehydratase
MEVEALHDRMCRCKRKTGETEILLELNLDGEGTVEIDTGIGFFDHMLHALGVHGSLDLSVHCSGDIEVDGHHSVEDCGIVFGHALKEILGDRAGIARFGCMLLPMVDSLAMVALDISGRPFLKYDAVFTNQAVGGFDTCLTKEFFQSLAFSAGITLHMRLLEGENDHHSCEAIFKAFAHALKQAVALRSQSTALSTKGVLS